MAGRAERQSPLVWLMPLGTLVQFMLPRWVMTRIAHVAGSIACRANRKQRARIEENLRHILGRDAPAAEVRRLTRRTFINLVQNYFDLLRVPVMKRRLASLVEIDPADFERTLPQGSGIVLVTPHLGNWDMAGAYLAAAGCPISAVVEPIPRGWTKTFNRYRGATAMETIPIPDRAAITRALERRRLLALVADRDLTGNGILCPAFDAVRGFPRGPAAYALRYGTPLVVGHLVFQHGPGRRPYRAEVKPLQFERSGDMTRDIVELTHAVAAELNQLIARHPDQWPVFHAGWRRPEKAAEPRP